MHNLAGVKKPTANGTHESASLLEQNLQYTTTTTTTANVGGLRLNSVPRSTATTVCIVPSGVPDGGGHFGGAQQQQPPQQPSLGAPAPRKRKFEQFLKNLVSRRASKEPASPPLIPTTTNAAINASSATIDLLKSSKLSPSEHNLTRSRINGGSTASLTESVHQKLWSVVPLLRKNGSCGSLHLHPPRPTTFADVEYSGLRKCETMAALMHHQSMATVNADPGGRGGLSGEPIRPLNRLRNCASIATCSRCSSLLSLAAGSKYSLNVSGGFIPVNSSANLCRSDSHSSVSNNSQQQQQQPTGTKFVCKLCLGEYTAENLTRISQCSCSFCTEVRYFFNSSNAYLLLYAGEFL